VNNDDLNIMIMNTIAGAIDGNVGSKIDRLTAINTKHIAQKSKCLAYRNSLITSRLNRFLQTFIYAFLLTLHRYRREFLGIELSIVFSLQNVDHSNQTSPHQ
jgi:hypothetical protein